MSALLFVLAGAADDVDTTEKKRSTLGRLIKKASLPHVPLRIEHGREELFTLISAQHQKNAFIEEAHEGIIELTVKMAKKIVGDAFEIQPSLLFQKYNETLAQVEALAPGKLWIHPRSKQITAIESRAAAMGFEVVTDAAMTPFDCVVEAGGVRIESRLETALYLFKKALENAREKTTSKKNET